TCPPDTSALITLTLIQGTVAGAISGANVVCNYENNETLVASGGNGQVIEWYTSVDSGATWLPTSTPDSSYSFSSILQNTWFAAEWQFGNCPAETTVWPITVLPV